jgi:hypothetical protein
LAAFTSLYPRPGIAGLFTRGLGETFDLPPLDGSNPTYILVNEMTDHLAVYTWGQYARRTFELVAQGYSLATTTHAETVAGVLDILERDLRIPRRQIAHLTFVGTIHIGYGNGRVLRRMSEVAFIQPDGDSGEDIHLSTIASWDRHDDSFRVLESPAQVSALALGNMPLEALMAGWPSGGVPTGFNARVGTGRAEACSPTDRRSAQKGIDHVLPAGKVGEDQRGAGLPQRIDAEGACRHAYWHHAVGQGGRYVQRRVADDEGAGGPHVGGQEAPRSMARATISIARANPHEAAGWKKCSRPSIPA